MISRVWEVFWRFLLLGCVSFGGPAAHIGYFQQAFVQRLKWLDQAAYARLIALSQFLPGPGSSQIGFAVGLQRAGLAGGLAAFIGFTLPSFMLLFGLATIDTDVMGSPLAQSIIQSLKLVALVVVLDACMKMQDSFCKNNLFIAIAVFTAVILLLAPSVLTQMGMLIMGATIGFFYSTKDVEQKSSEQSENTRKIPFRWLPLSLFALLFVGLPVVASLSSWTEIFSAFYQSGSLVFGGGHVVLPLLQQTLGEAVSSDRFLLGYAAAQAVPGPMFTLASFLGAELSPEYAFAGALIATVGIFLPGFLLVYGLQAGWEALAARPGVAGIVAGVNAAVVGLLYAAFFQLLVKAEVISVINIIAVLVGCFLLRRFKLHIFLLISAFVGMGALQAI